MTALAELRALNRLFIHNYVTNDVVSHDAILHPDFAYMSSDGKRVDRRTYLRKWATGFHPDVIVYWDMRDEKITIAGDTAIVRATNKYVEKIEHGDQTGMASYTDVYVRKNGRWLCIHAQISNVAPANWPDDRSIVCQYRMGIQQI